MSRRLENSGATSAPQITSSASNMVCVCRVSDKLVREFAKARNLPLKYVRDIKRLHNRFKIHELAGGDGL